MRHEIDTSGWKKFPMSDLGFLNYHGERLNKAARIEGDIPFITAGFDNQGVAQYIGNDRSTYMDPITVDMFGNCFFHKGKCAGDDNVYFFVNDNVSDICKLFIATCIHTVTSEQYAYVEQFRQPDANALTVKLPASACGDPDWDYMDACMSKILAEEQTYVEKLSEHDFAKREIDTSEWKEFPIGSESGLFDVVKGTRLTKADMIEGDINFISASSFNNGIAAHVGNTEHIHPGNLLTVSYNGSDIGRTFYQADPFWASDDVNVLYPRFAMTEHIALFLAPLIKEAGSSHMYKDKWLQTDMMAAKILLPISHDGRPDWNYMDAYMSKIMGEEKSVVDELTAGCD